MNTYYTLKNGTRLEVFMWDDFFENDTWRGYADVTALYDGKIYGGKRGKECRKKLFKDDKGIYIVWDGQRVYLNDFDYDTVEVMAKRIAECVIQSDHWLVSDDEILATFIKDTDNVGIVMDMPAYDMVCASLGFGIVGDNEQTVLCVPTERQYAKKDWHYKFTAECEYEPLRQYIASRHFYFSDFCSFLKAGHAKLVVKEDFKNKVQNYIEMVEQEKKNKSYKIKKFFGLVEEEKNPYLAVSVEV